MNIEDILICMKAKAAALHDAARREYKFLREGEKTLPSMSTVSLTLTLRALSHMERLRLPKAAT